MLEIQISAIKREKNRMKYTKTKDYIRSINLASRNKLYIAGAGKYGEILGKYFDKHRIAWEGYVDKRRGLSEINEKPVFSYDEVREGYYAISTYIYRNEVEEELAKRGIKPEQILIYEKQEIFHDIYNDLINWSDDTKKIKEFNNKHIGKRCFIIGNGPSLKISDLEKINNEISFASNSIYALYAHTDWRPTYYCATDSVFCKQIMSEKKNVIMLLDGCKAAFTSITGEGIYYKDDADIEKLYYIRSLTKRLNDGFPEFSVDCSKYVYSSSTITYSMLQLAIYMGIKEIYLLGIDFSFSVERYNNRIIKNNVYNHMKEIEVEEKKGVSKALIAKYGVSYLADMDLQLAGYQKAKQYADAHGIKIYNATRGGKLEVFPRVDFDSLFE